MTLPHAEEGSDERRHARMQLAEEAKRARRDGASFDAFVERAPQYLIDAVTQRDLDALFHLVWKSKRPLL